MHMYIFFCSVAVFNIQEQDQKAGSSTNLHPTASVSAYLAIMRRKALGFFHYHATQRHVTAAISNPKLSCAWMYAQAMGSFSCLEPLDLIFNERVVVWRPRDQNDRLWGWEWLWPRMDHQVLGLAHALSTSYEWFHTPSGIWKGRPDPALVHLSHEIPHPALFFIAFPNLVFSFLQNTYIKKG